MLLVESSNPSVFQLLDPLCQLEDPVTEGNVKVGHLPVVLDVSIRGVLEYVFIMLDMVVEPVDLFFEAANFAGLLCVASGDGVEEPFGDGSKDVCIKIGVGCQSGRNSIGQHRWFRALDRSDWERAVVFSGRDV